MAKRNKRNGSPTASPDEPTMVGPEAGSDDSGVDAVMTSLMGSVDENIVDAIKQKVEGEPWFTQGDPIQVEPHGPAELSVAYTASLEGLEPVEPQPSTTVEPIPTEMDFTALEAPPEPPKATTVLKMLVASLQEEKNTADDTIKLLEARLEALLAIEAESTQHIEQLLADRTSLERDNAELRDRIGALEMEASVGLSALTALSTCALWQITPGHKMNQGKSTRILVLAHNASEAITKVVGAGMAGAQEVENLTKVTDKVVL